MAKNDRAAWEAVIDKRSQAVGASTTATTARPTYRDSQQARDVGEPAGLPVRDGGVAQSVEQRLVTPKIASSNLAVPAKASKYFARRVYYDFIWFASQAEYRRYTELRTLERGGVIRNLIVHPVFPLHVNGIYVGRYSADFAYLRQRRITSGLLTEWIQVCEDVKSPRTSMLPSYRKNVRMVKAQYGIDITTVPA